MHCHGEHAFSYKSTLFTQTHPTHYTETCTRCFQYTPPKHMPVMPDGCTCMLRIALVASFAYARFAYEAPHTPPHVLQKHHTPMHTLKDRIRNTIQTLSRVWSHIYTWLHNTYMKEVKAQRSYWDSWTRDPSLLHRGMHCIIYVPFTLPMRLWTLCPSPERVALLLGGVTVLAEMYPG
jgi:hypothetical protein